MLTMQRPVPSTVPRESTSSGFPFNYHSFPFNHTLRSIPIPFSPVKKTILVEFKHFDPKFSDLNITRYPCLRENQNLNRLEKKNSMRWHKNHKRATNESGAAHTAPERVFAKLMFAGHVLHPRKLTY